MLYAYPKTKQQKKKKGRKVSLDFAESISGISNMQWPVATCEGGLRDQLCGFPTSGDSNRHKHPPLLLPGDPRWPLITVLYHARPQIRRSLLGQKFITGCTPQIGLELPERR